MVSVVSIINPREIRGNQKGSIFINFCSKSKFNLLSISGKLNFTVVVSKDHNRVSKYEEQFQLELIPLTVRDYIFRSEPIPSQGSFDVIF